MKYLSRIIISLAIFINKSLSNILIQNEFKSLTTFNHFLKTPVSNIHTGRIFYIHS